MHVVGSDSISQQSRHMTDQLLNECVERTDEDKDLPAPQIGDEVVRADPLSYVRAYASSFSRQNAYVTFPCGTITRRADLSRSRLIVVVPAGMRIQTMLRFASG